MTTVATVRRQRRLAPLLCTGTGRFALSGASGAIRTAAAPRCLLTTVLFDLASIVPRFEFGTILHCRRRGPVDVAQMGLRGGRESCFQVLVTARVAGEVSGSGRHLISLNARLRSQRIVRLARSSVFQSRQRPMPWLIISKTRLPPPP